MNARSQVQTDGSGKDDNKQERQPNVNNRSNRTLPYIFGTVFTGMLLLIAFIFPNPSVFQYTTFRIVLALAAAGVAATIPGLLSFRLGNAMRMGGAMSVFAITYFISPASLVTSSTPAGAEHALIVNPRPSDADIEITDVQLPYHRGILLKTGKYSVVVTRHGFHSYKKEIFLNQDTSIDVTLDPIKLTTSDRAVIEKRILHVMTLESAQAEGPDPASSVIFKESIIDDYVIAEDNSILFKGRLTVTMLSYEFQTTALELILKEMVGTAPDFGDPNVPIKGRIIYPNKNEVLLAEFHICPGIELKWLGKIPGEGECVQATEQFVQESNTIF